MTATTCPTCGQPVGVVALLPALLSKAASLVPGVGPVLGPLTEALVKEALKLFGDEPQDIERAAMPDMGAVIQDTAKQLGDGVSQ